MALPWFLADSDKWELSPALYTLVVDAIKAASAGNEHTAAANALRNALGNTWSLEIYDGEELPAVFNYTGSLSVSVGRLLPPSSYSSSTVNALNASSSTLVGRIISLGNADRFLYTGNVGTGSNRNVWLSENFEPGDTPSISGNIGFPPEILTEAPAPAPAPAPGPGPAPAPEPSPAPGPVDRLFADDDVTNLTVGINATYANTSDKATNLVRASVGFNGSVGPSSTNPTPQEWSIPRYYGNNSHPQLKIRVYAPGSNPSNGTVVTVRAPSGARPSRPWKPSDGHFCVVNGNIIHEFWLCEPANSSHPEEWHAASYTPAPLKGASWGYYYNFGTDFRIPGMLGWGSTRAFGGSQNLGLVTRAELEAGLIPHAIGFAQRDRDHSTTNAPGFNHRWVWPATRDDGGRDYKEDVNGVRQGQYYGIPRSVNIDAEASSRGWHPYVKTIAKALQDYGAMVIDQSGGTCMYLELTTRNSALYSIIDNDNFNNQLRSAWNMLRRITNHTQATPKGRGSSDPAPSPSPSPAPAPEPPPPPTSLVNYPFKSDSAWNTKIPASAIWRGTSDPRTAMIRRNYGGGSHYDGDPKDFKWALNMWDYTIATWYASNGDPTVTIYQGGQQFVVNCPANAVPSGGSDRHMCIIDPDGLHSHDMWGAIRSGNRIDAESYVKTKLAGEGWRMVEERLQSPSNPRGLNTDNASAGGGGPRAVSAASLGGLIRKYDLDLGVINHALVFATPRRWANGRFGVRVHPANWISLGDGDESSGRWEPFTGTIRYSDRFALDKNINVNSLGLSREWTMIAKALQEYGMYMGDVAGPNNPCIYVEWPSVGNTPAYSGMKDLQEYSFAKITPHLMAIDWY